MSTVSYGIITFNEENEIPTPFVVAGSIYTTLENKNYRTNNKQGEDLLLPSSGTLYTEISPHRNVIIARFQDGEQYRSLFVQFPDTKSPDSKGDFGDIFGRNKLIFSIGHWGNDRKIIEDMIGGLRHLSNSACWFLEKPWADDAYWQSF